MGAWWREGFTATRFWAATSAAFLPPIDAAQLPSALIERFSGDGGSTDRAAPLPRSDHGRRPHARFLMGEAGPQRMLVATVPMPCLRLSASDLQERRHGRRGRETTASRTVGALALLRHRPAVGRAAAEGRAAGRASCTQPAHLAASDDG